MEENQKLNQVVTKNSDDYNQKYMKVNFNSDGELTLNKTIELLLKQQL